MKISKFLYLLMTIFILSGCSDNSSRTAVSAPDFEGIWNPSDSGYNLHTITVNGKMFEVSETMIRIKMNQKGRYEILSPGSYLEFVSFTKIAGGYEIDVEDTIFSDSQVNDPRRNKAIGDFIFHFEGKDSFWIENKSSPVFGEITLVSDWLSFGKTNPYKRAKEIK